jgi:hypothetical protein
LFSTASEIATDFFSVASEVATTKNASELLDFVIRANGELQHGLQLKFNDVIVLKTKLILGRPRTSQFILKRPMIMIKLNDFSFSKP